MSSLSGLALAVMLLVSQACSSEPPPAERPPEPPEQAVAPEQPVPPEPAPPPEPPPEPVQPEEPPKLAIDLPPLDQTCKADSDCAPAPGCCPVPCTSYVINRSAMAEAQQRLEALCPEVRECGNAGGCRTHEYLCVKGTCALVYKGEKHYRKRR